MEKLRGPTPKQCEAIASEIGEYEGKLEANVAALSTWLSYQPHLPNVFDDKFLALFLRGCKHDLGRTKRKVDHFFAARGLYRELFAEWDPTHPLISDATKILEIVPLPVLTDDGCRVTIHRVLNYDHNIELNIVFMLRYIFMLGDIRIREETMISGDIFIFDLEMARASDSLKVVAPWVRKGLVITHEGYPQRLKQIHLVNVPKAVASIIPAFKMCMKEKVRNRFHFHTSPKTLCEHLQTSVLPADYGGEQPSLATLASLWLHKMRNSKDYLKNQSTIVADVGIRSSKIPTSCLKSETYYGYEGSFRKLNID